MLTLTNLKSPRGANKNTKRLGRGKASGQGVQAGKGHKGQNARTGGGVRTGFEGGQMPIYRRLAKRGFKNMPFKIEYAVVNVGAIDKKFSDGQEVNRETLKAAGLLTGANKRRPIKVLGTGQLTKKLKFVGVDKFSETAMTIIKKCGGTVVEAKEGSK